MKSALRFQRHASVLSIKIRPKSALNAGLKSCKKNFAHSVVPYSLFYWALRREVNKDDVL